MDRVYRQDSSVTGSVRTVANGAKEVRMVQVEGHVLHHIRVPGVRGLGLENMACLGGSSNVP